MFRWMQWSGSAMPRCRCSLYKYRSSSSMIYAAGVKPVMAFVVGSRRRSRCLDGRSIVEPCDWLRWCRRDVRSRPTPLQAPVISGVGERAVPSLEAYRYYETPLIWCSSNFHCRLLHVVWNHFAPPYGSAFPVYVYSSSSHSFSSASWFLHIFVLTFRYSLSCHLQCLSGLAVTCLTEVWDDQGSNPTAGICMFFS